VVLIKKIENIFVKTYLLDILQDVNYVFNAKKQALKLVAFQTSRQKIMEMI
jgi:hypothetical protein